MTFARSMLFATALCAMAALNAPAFAQTQSAAGDLGSGMTGINLGGGDQPVDEGTLQKRREIEEAYKSATKGQPAAQTTAVNDPWANMRGPEEQKAAAKPAAPKTAQKKKPAQ